MFNTKWSATAPGEVHNVEILKSILFFYHYLLLKHTVTVKPHRIFSFRSNIVSLITRPKVTYYLPKMGEEMKYLFIFIFSFFHSSVKIKKATLSSTQHAMPPEFSGKWRTECLNTVPFAYPVVCGI